LSVESNNYPLLGGQMLENYFNYKKHKTDFKTEVVAGTTTFLTMAYIMFLNPFILSGEFAGPEKGFFDFGAVYTATILATALACFIMAFYGKTWPIGLAPGMGINAFVAFGVCAGMGYTPQEALGCSTSCWCIVFNYISYTY
jgi:AGZA family xanthine/uracil permease-like MFS transporter